MNLNDMLIQQCDTWLSAEEGNRNMMETIEKRRRAEKLREKNEKRRKRSERWRRWKQAITRLFKLKTKN
jgi:hypothetical protein